MSWRIRPGIDPGFNQFALADRLRVRGWQVPAYTLPADCLEQVVQRILVRHGVSRDLAGLLLGDIRKAIDHLQRHPSQGLLNAEEASGFHH